MVKVKKYHMFTQNFKPREILEKYEIKKYIFNFDFYAGRAF